MHRHVQSGCPPAYMLDVNALVEATLRPLAREFSGMPTRAQQDLIANLENQGATKTRETMESLEQARFLPYHDLQQWVGMTYNVVAPYGPDRYTHTVDRYTPAAEGHNAALHVCQSPGDRFLTLTRNTVRDYVMLHHGLGGRATFELARIVHLARGSILARQLGLPSPESPSVCPCVLNRPCSLSKTHTFLTPEYFAALRALPAKNPTSWQGMQEPTRPDKWTCVCGGVFESELALDLHAASELGGLLHDRPPECRPRLGGASILIDATNPNPYGAVIAACAARFPSRSLNYESSTSTEIRQYAAGLEAFRALIPDGYEVIQSTDSEGGRALQKAHNDRTKSARHEVRTTELGELRRARYPRDDLRTRGVDVISAHEGAAHNRQRKGTSDQLLTPTSRANHGCDLEAGRIAMAGRDDEAQFYSAGAPQQHCSYYWTNCGRPLLGDVFDDAGLVADRIHMARVLKNESRKPHGSRAKCTHIAPARGIRGC